MALAGIMNLIVAAALGEYSHAHWTPQAIGAVAYLIVFGSWVGYSSFIWLLQNVSMSKVGTYAYVNPVVAVFLGWLFLRERVDGFIAAGTAIIVVSVALVTGARVHKREAAPEKRAAEASD
jgi:drug/metabolite transporter (DMT)-like permease